MPAGQPKHRLALVLAAMTLANAMILVDQTAVPLALPNIMKEFHVGSQDSQWVLNASLLPLAGLLVLGGRLGDLFGRRRVFVLGTVLFAGASAIGGLAPAMPLLLAARVVQGMGGALMLPTTVAIVGATYPAERRGWALGTMGGAAAVAGALGPTIGGVLTTALSWRAGLLVNVPLAIGAVLLALRHVPADRARTERQHPDISGTVLLCVVLVGLVFGLSQSQQWGWTTPVVLGPLALSARGGRVRDPRAPGDAAAHGLQAAAPSQLPRGFAEPALRGYGRDGARRDLPTAADHQPRHESGAGRSRPHPHHGSDGARRPSGRTLVRPCGRARAARGRVHRARDLRRPAGLGRL